MRINKVVIIILAILGIALLAYFLYPKESEIVIEEEVVQTKKSLREIEDPLEFTEAFYEAYIDYRRGLFKGLDTGDPREEFLTEALFEKHENQHSADLLLCAQDIPGIREFEKISHIGDFAVIEYASRMERPLEEVPAPWLYVLVYLEKIDGSWMIYEVECAPYSVEMGFYFF